MGHELVLDQSKLRPIIVTGGSDELALSEAEIFAFLFSRGPFWAEPEDPRWVYSSQTAKMLPADIATSGTSIEHLLEKIHHAYSTPIEACELGLVESFLRQVGFSVDVTELPHHRGEVGIVAKRAKGDQSITFYVDKNGRIVGMVIFDPKHRRNLPQNPDEPKMIEAFEIKGLFEFGLTRSIHYGDDGHVLSVDRMGPVCAYHDRTNWDIIDGDLVLAGFEREFRGLPRENIGPEYIRVRF